MTAPPLFVSCKPTPAMPAVRSVSQAASEYLSQSGQSIDAAYPDDVAMLRKMAPALTLGDTINPASVAFALAARLPMRDIYPEPPIGPAAIVFARVTGVEIVVAPRRNWTRWAGVAIGAAAGAAAAVPLGLALGAGAAVGGVLGYAVAR